MASQHDISREDTSVETKINNVNDDEARNAGCDCTPINLGEFLASKLSEDAMKKLKEHVKSGDLSVDTVNECNEQELNGVAKECGLSILETKRFINAIKKLPNSKVSRTGTNIGDSSNVHVSTKRSSDHSKVYESKEAIDSTLAHEVREIKNRLNKLCELLDHQKQANSKWIIENNKKTEKNNEKLDEIGNILKKQIDTIISKLKTKQWEEFENSKQKIKTIEGDFNEEYENITSIERKLTQLEIYTYPTDIETDITSRRNMIDRLISQSIAARELSVIKDIFETNKSNSERIRDIATSIEKQIKGLVNANVNVNPSTRNYGDYNINYVIGDVTPPFRKETMVHVLPEIPLDKLDRFWVSHKKVQNEESI